MSVAPWPVAEAALRARSLPGRQLVPGLTAPPAERCAQVWRQPIPPGPGFGAPNPLWWWLAAHGGAGVSTLTNLIAISADARGLWPSGDPRQSPLVVVVTRTHTEGLERARDLLLQQKVRGLVPPTLRVLGLVTVADAPGKLPREVRRLRDLVSAAAPAAWHLPWVEEWRCTRLTELPIWHPNSPVSVPHRRDPVSPTLPPAYLACAVELTTKATLHPPSTRGDSL